jgi:hypothetical protein
VIPAPHFGSSFFCSTKEEQAARKSGIMISQESGSDGKARLDRLFQSYRAACPEVDASPNFMPDLWARIEAREVSTTWFGRVAKVLVTSALAGSAILGMIISSTSQPNAFFDATFVEALRAEHASTLEPLHLDRISEFEPR